MKFKLLQLLFLMFSTIVNAQIEFNQEKVLIMEIRDRSAYKPKIVKEEPKLEDPHAYLYED